MSWLPAGTAPQCYACLRLWPLEPGSGWRCSAFDKGIPKAILVNGADHRMPIEGDGGLRFVPRTEDDSAFLADEFKESEHPRDGDGKFTEKGVRGASGSGSREININGAHYIVEASGGRPTKIIERMNVGAGQTEDRVKWTPLDDDPASYVTNILSRVRKEDPEFISPPSLPNINEANVGELPTGLLMNAKREVMEYTEHLFETKDYDRAREVHGTYEVIKGEIERREELKKQARVEERRSAPQGDPTQVAAIPPEFEKVPEKDPLWHIAPHGTGLLLEGARKAGYSDSTIASCFAALKQQGWYGKSEDSSEGSGLSGIAAGHFGGAEQSLLRAIGEREASKPGVSERTYYRSGTFGGQPLLSTTRSSAGASMPTGPGQFASIGWDEKRSGADLLSEGYLPFGETFIQGYGEEHETLWIKFPHRADAAPRKTQAEAQYEAESPHEGEECRGCSKFVGPSACQIVAGEINEGGWCPGYEAGSKFFADAATTPVQIRAAGVLFVAPRGRILLVRRTAEGDHQGEWAIPGGKLEDGEDAEQAARRECEEEIGRDPGTLNEWTRTVRGGVDYTTFVAAAPEEFEPKLNGEHDAFQWVDRREALEGRADAAFVESEHPRDEDGKFTSGSGSGGDQYFSGPEVEDAWAEAQQPASRSTIVRLSPSDFLSLAEPGDDPEKDRRVGQILKEGKTFRSLPYLLVNDLGKVIGHEGRHRMRALAQLGVTSIPVILRSTVVRWGQDQRQAPKMLIAQGKGRSGIAVPTPRSETFPPSRSDSVLRAVLDGVKTATITQHVLAGVRDGAHRRAA